jgi:hypothetical protein
MENTKKSRHKGKRSPPPLRPDQLLRLDNVLKHSPLPKELQRLKSSNSFTLVNTPSDFRLEHAIHEVHLKSGMSAWNIDTSAGQLGLGHAIADLGASKQVICLAPGRGCGWAGHLKSAWPRSRRQRALAEG